MQAWVTGPACHRRHRSEAANAARVESCTRQTRRTSSSAGRHGRALWLGRGCLRLSLDERERETETETETEPETETEGILCDRQGGLGRHGPARDPSGRSCRNSPGPAGRRVRTHFHWHIHRDRLTCPTRIGSESLVKSVHWQPGSARSWNRPVPAGESATAARAGARRCHAVSAIGIDSTFELSESRRTSCPSHGAHIVRVTAHIRVEPIR